MWRLNDVLCNTRGVYKWVFSLCIPNVKWKMGAYQNATSDCTLLLINAMLDINLSSVLFHVSFEQNMA